MIERLIVRKHRPDFFVVLLMGVIMLVGLIVIFAIGPQRANVLNSIYGSDYPVHHFFINQLFSVVVALAVFFIAAKFPFDIVKKVAKSILAVAVIACVVLAIAGFLNLGIANCTNGACRWFNIGTKSFQPSELLKLGLLIYLSVELGQAMKEKKVNNLSTLRWPVIATLVSLFLVVVLQKDLGTGVAISGIVMSQLVISGFSKKRLMILLAVAVGAALVLIVAFPHRRERMLTFLEGDSSETLDSNSYHITHAKIAIGSGGLFGVGIGNSVQATGYLPESINDSVFAIMGETFGFIGLMFIIGLFVALLMRLLKSVYYLHDPTSRLFVAGTFGWLAAHVIMNIAAMIGILPLTGITLPFLSYGGTSMMFIAAALGFAFQLSAYTAHTPVDEERIKDGENSSSRRRIRRTRNASVSSRHRN